MYNPFFQNFGYPQYPQMRAPQYNQPQFITKQVTSIEEARASMIDPLSTYLFVDTSTGNIYLKRLNNNGLSDFFTFKAEEPNAVKSDPLSDINKRLSSIEKMLGGINVQSVSKHADDAESKSDGYVSIAEPEPTVIQQGAADGSRQVRGRNEADGNEYC